MWSNTFFVVREIVTAPKIEFSTALFFFIRYFLFQVDSGGSVRRVAPVNNADAKKTLKIDVLVTAGNKSGVQFILFFKYFSLSTPPPSAVRLHLHPTNRT